jgi:heme-degrading monooxygenase HmoA
MIRVLLERHIVEGMEETFSETLRDLRQSAVGCPGYVSGESLHDRQDPLHQVVISTWRSIGNWEAWARSEARAHALARMAACLHEPEKVTVLEHV